MDENWRCSREIVKGTEPSLNPPSESRVYTTADLFKGVFVLRFPSGLNRQHNEFCPGLRECQPLLVACICWRQIFFENLKQTREAFCSVPAWISGNPKCTPARTRPSGVGPFHRLKQAFYKKVVDVHSNVRVLKRQIGRTGDNRVRHDNTCSRQKSVEEYWPPLLQKCEEGTPVLKQELQRPIVEPVCLRQDLDQPTDEQWRHCLDLVMPAKQHPKQIRVRVDQLCGNLENVTENEVFGCVVSQDTGTESFLCL